MGAKGWMRLVAVATLAALVVGAPALSGGTARAVHAVGGDVEDLTPLKDTVPFPIGVAIDARETTGDAAKLLLRHFNQFTPENHMKPEAWYDSTHAFAPNPQIASLMDFAQANNLRVYGHVLVWHRQVPSWFFLRDDGVTPLTSDPADQEILRQRLHDHIFSVARYLSDGWGPFGGGNPVVAFDVVNEVISDNPSDPDGMRQSEWYRILGEQYIDLAFEYADEAFNHQYAAPGADKPVTLFINDYNTEVPSKRANYLALIDRLLARGVPIGGIGHQFHVNLGVPVEDLAAALDDASGRGLVQAVTEFDAPTGGTSAADFIRQGYYYRDAFRVFRAHAKELFSVTVWGLDDARSWRASEGGPLIFDGNLRAKPAYYGIVDGHSDETPISAFEYPRDWTPYSIGFGLVVFAGAMVGLRVMRRRRRTAWKRRLAGGADQEWTRDGAVDGLSRPLPQKKRRGS